MTSYDPPKLGSYFEVLDSRFRIAAQPNAWVERLWTGSRWAEGPAWFADTQTLVFSDLPNDRQMQWVDGLGCREFRRPSNFANGNTRDREGRLISCEHGGRRVTRTEFDGSITVLADRYEGKRLNSPNDAVVKSDGSIWFTDPPYGLLNDYEGHKGESEIGACNVYRLDPKDGSLKVVADDFVRPNGICFSPDESRLYVADSSISHDPNGNRHIRVFDVGADGRRRGWRTRSRAGWNADRQGEGPRGGIEPVLRWREEEPFVHRRHDFALRGVCGHDRRTALLRHPR